MILLDAASPMTVESFIATTSWDLEAQDQPQNLAIFLEWFGYDENNTDESDSKTRHQWLWTGYDPERYSRRADYWWNGYVRFDHPVASCKRHESPVSAISKTPFRCTCALSTFQTLRTGQHCPNSKCSSGWFIPGSRGERHGYWRNSCRNWTCFKAAPRLSNT